MGEQHTLPSSAQLDLPLIECLPAWLPDETLFSWCSRYHLLVANGLAKVTYKQLFGHHHTGNVHDLPHRIDEFVRRSNGALGTAEEIIRDRTLLQFYLPFKEKYVAEFAYANMRGSATGSLQYRFGLLSSSLGVSHPLKACSACMTDDQKTYHVAYWHRVHQLPGVWTCPRHGIHLWLSEITFQGHTRCQWVLPIHAGLKEQQSNSFEFTSIRSVRSLRGLTDLSISLIASPAGLFADSIRLRKVFLDQLSVHGFITKEGRIKWKKLLDAGEQNINQLSNLPIVQNISTREATRSQLTRLINGRSLMDPLQYLIWINWLFASWEDFKTRFEQYDSMLLPESASTPRTSKLQNDRREAQAVMLLQEGTQSATAIARKLKLDPTTVAMWGARQMIMPRRRPKILKPAILKTAIANLSNGWSKAEVAQANGISIVTVTKILLSEPGLSEKWHRLLFEKKKNEVRQIWVELQNYGRGYSMQFIRKISPATYSWLYHNDPDWLRYKISEINPTRLELGQPQVQPDPRDQLCALEVQQTAALLNDEPVGNQVTMSQLRLRLPILQCVIRRLDAWPETALVLHHVLFASAKDALNQLSLDDSRNITE